MIMPRMRTLSEAAAELRTEDPNTAITLHFLRNEVRSGRLPSIRAGGKYLVSLETLTAYLSGTEQQQAGIHRIV